MRQLSKILLVLFSALLFSHTVVAQDNVIGKWNIVAETPEGESKSVWEFSRNGDDVSGKSIDEATGAVAEFEDVKISGNDVSFSLEIDFQGTSLQLDLEATVEGNELSGDWVASDSSGNDLASGNLSGEKVAQKKKKSKKDMVAGEWDSIAVLPDGTESESIVTIANKDGKLSGGMKGDNGSPTFESVSLSGKTLSVAFEIEVQGSMRNIEIEAELQDDGSLEGEWILVQDEQEMATGPWSATKKMTTEVLFDGSSMDSFRGYKEEAIGAGWKVVDGTLHFDGTRSGDIITKKEYGSFELTFDWKVSEGGNSGVMYRVTLGDNAPYMSGIEYQILDNDKHADGKSRTTSAAALYALYQPGDKMPKAVGEWNSSKIVVDGDKVEHWLNGDKVVDVEIGSDEWKEKVAESKFASWKKFGKSKRGHIAFQDHSDPVWYRNIKIKAMD